jgi:DNA-binding transcriptional ArsR family regulator
MSRGGERMHLGFEVIMPHKRLMDTDAPEDVGESVPPAKPDTGKTLRQKWRTSLDTGWTAIPSALIRGLPLLHIGAGELAVLIILIDYWWAPNDPPWPSKKALAERLSVSQKTIQRHLAVLRQEGLITSEARHRAGGGQTSNRYDLTPLVTKLEGIAAAMKKADAEAAKVKRAAIRLGLRAKPTNGGAA